VLVQEADSAGRAAVVEIRWPGGSRRMTGEEFHILLGRKLGWGRVKSARFTVRQVPGGWLFQGRGLGHGVGMCQWGANARAQAGQTMAEILSHYFPGTDLAERR
jgi:stage II sporulation protein D